MKKFDLGYISGFIDGEGYIGICKNRQSKVKRGFSYICVLSIGNTDLEVLKYIKEIFGCGYIIQEKKYTNRSTIYRYRIYSNSLRNILPKLKLKIKQNDQKLVLEALKLISKLTKNRFNLWKNESIETKIENIYLELRKNHANRA